MAKIIENFNSYDPCQTGDGNRYFSTISFLIIGSTAYHKEVKGIQ